MKFPIGVPTEIGAFVKNRLRIGAQSPFHPSMRRDGYLRLVEAFDAGRPNPRGHVVEVSEADMFTLCQFFRGFLIHESHDDIPDARGFTKGEQAAASDWAQRLLPAVERLERGGVVDYLALLDADSPAG